MRKRVRKAEQLGMAEKRRNRGSQEASLWALPLEPHERLRET